MRGTLIYLGYHDTPLQAAAAYDLAAYKTYGRRAVTNLELDSYGKDLLASLDAEPMDALVARLRRSEERLRSRQTGSGGPARFRGVVFSGGYWKAQIKANGRLVPLGQYESQHSAIAAYEQASKVLQGQGPAGYAGFPGMISYARSWEEQAAQVTNAAAFAHAALGRSANGGSDSPLVTAPVTPTESDSKSGGSSGGSFRAFRRQGSVSLSDSDGTQKPRIYAPVASMAEPGKPMDGLLMLLEAAQ